MANQCIKDGVFDFWEVCRPLLADPELIHKAAEDRLDEVRRCIGSLNCLSRLFRDLPYTCTMNPALGHEVEPEYHITPAAVKKKIMVIGAGPAGMEAAITARKRGHDVTVFEKADRIGGNLRRLCQPTTWPAPTTCSSVIRHYEVMAKKLGIEMRFNTEANAKFMRSMLHQYDVCLVAAGARTDMAAYRALEGAGMLAGRCAGCRARPGQAGAKRVVMIGGGKIGLTLAESLPRRGHEVVVVEEEKRIAGDVMPSFKWRHTAWVEELEIPDLHHLAAPHHRRRRERSEWQGRGNNHRSRHGDRRGAGPSNQELVASWSGRSTNCTCAAIVQSRAASPGRSTTVTCSAAAYEMPSQTGSIIMQIEQPRASHSQAGKRFSTATRTSSGVCCRARELDFFRKTTSSPEGGDDRLGSRSGGNAAGYEPFPGFEEVKIDLLFVADDADIRRLHDPHTPTPFAEIKSKVRRRDILSMWSGRAMSCSIAGTRILSNCLDFRSGLWALPLISATIKCWP